MNISDIPSGEYELKIYKVGYRVNDPYTTYYDMGRPNQLTKEQVHKIKEQNDGSEISTEKIVINENVPFNKQIMILSQNFKERQAKILIF